MFKFIDLFSGIGGMHLACAEQECVMACDVNSASRTTYWDNFGIMPHRDIRTLEEVPRHDLMLAGFPCQPFSISGFQKGFTDDRGNLFFDIIRLAITARPKCILLENVKNFSKHDNGRSISIVTSSLKKIGYKVSWEVLNAKNFGLAQSRERTIMVATRKTLFDFSMLENHYPEVQISDILDELQEPISPQDYTLLPGEIIKKQTSGLIFVGYRNKALRLSGVRPGTENLSRAHKQPNRIYSSEGIHPTLSAGETTGRYFIQHAGVVRKLSLREVYRLQGFPEDFKINPNITSAYRQIGNAVPVPMIKAVVNGLLRQGFLA